MPIGVEVGVGVGVEVGVGVRVGSGEEWQRTVAEIEALRLR